LGTTKVK